MIRQYLKNYILKSLTDIKDSFTLLFWFDLSFKIVAALIISPFITWVFSRLVSSTGKHVLSDFEIASFLLSPGGIGTLVIVAGLILFFSMLEQTGLIHIILHETKAEKLTLTETKAWLIDRFSNVLKLSFIITLAFLIITAPFIVFAAPRIMALLSEFDIYYYINVRPPEFWQAVTIAVPVAVIYLVLALYLYLAWTFALPVMNYKGASTAFLRCWILAHLLCPAINQSSCNRTKQSILSCGGLPETTCFDEFGGLMRCYA